MDANVIPATSGIYRIVCTVTGKCYVGSATSLRRRWYEHRSNLQRNAHPNPKLQSAFNKYGEESFLFEVLELVLIPDLLTAREQYWFDKLKPFGKKGFNLSHIAGSTIGMFHSPEALAKMSAAKLGRVVSPETCAKLSIAGLGNTNHRGKKASLETRAKQSTAHLGNPSHLGRKPSPEHCANLRSARAASSFDRKKTLIIIDPAGVEYTIHGISGFCREHHLDRSKLRQVAQGKRTHHKGYKARYPETDAD